ncbi:acyl carrier protein [Micromonospora sp. NPDC047557]|uniref:acyl carrier protein n=1 Tax=Micromonospora sp. NPDC047557 TaxID=3364250 RepID=UPI003719DF56
MSLVQERFHTLLSTKLGISESEFTASTTLEDLEFDSLALIELSVALQKEFGVVLDETEMTIESTVGEIGAKLDEVVAA